MKRRDFLKGCGALLGGAYPRAQRYCPAAEVAASRMADTSGMSLLFITIDDLAADALGCYGHTSAETAHLDRFAGRAIRFNRCYCQTPVPNGSRSSYLTGLRAETTGVLREDDPYDDLVPAPVRSVPEILHRYRFRTANIGKLFGNPDHACRPLSAFDLFADANGLEPHEADRQRAQLAAEILAEMANARRPFFMSLGLSALQPPLQCPWNCLERHDPESISVVELPGREGRGDRCARASLPEPPGGDARRQAMDAYDACVSFADAQVGVVLDALDRAQLSNDTIVAIFSDRGFHPDECGEWSGGRLLEPSSRVPLLMRIPRVTRRQIVCDEIVELVDLLPTLCELLMVPMPDRLEGQSFVPLVRDPLQPWKRAAFTTCATRERIGRSVRTKRWRYIDWQATGSSRRQFALYDLDKDPCEQINLATDADYRSERTILANLLQRGWQAAR